jgi:hypothetical protein
MQKPSDPDEFYYPFDPVSSRARLAKMLRCASIEELDRVEGQASALYYVAKREVKPDGRVRICYNAMPPLKSMHARTMCMILKHVKFPAYVTGGISDPLAPRDYIRNAERHLGARILVHEDVARFFPSTPANLVYDIWRQFFRFPRDVARTLTALTTKDGGLPQGAKTSGYLANLAFWRTEPKVYKTLCAQGFRYGRYIDDLGISSTETPSNQSLGTAISQLNTMVRQSGLTIGRKKHEIMRAGGKKRLEITGVVVSSHASMKREKRAVLRAMVHRCERLAEAEPESEECSTLLQKVSCRVGQLKRLHPAEARKLHARVAKVRERLKSSRQGVAS